MIIFKALFIISLYLFPGVFFLKNFNLKKIGLAVLISFVLNSLLWFWLLWLFKLNPQLLITAGLAFNLFFFFIAKKINFELYGESGSNVYKITFGLIAFLILFITAFLYYPLIKPVWIDGYQFFRFPGVFDAFKHLFVVTAIKETGVPPFHPYFPQATLSYYYGWYILPAVASLITNLDFKFAFYIHFLITVLLYLFLTSFLIKKTISENLGRVIALIFATVGFGWDIVPTLIYWGQRQGIIHIEIWISHLKTLLQITSFPTAIIWVPQHLLAVMISLLVVNLLMKAKDVKIYLLAAVLSAYVVFSSIFVAISLFVFIIFTFVKKILEHQEKFTRIFVQYLFMGGGVFLILFPYILSLLSQRGNILKFQLVYPKPGFPFLPSNSLFNLIFDLIFEFGGGIILFVIIGLKKLKSSPSFVYLIIPSFIFLFAVHIITSPTTNDFGMRSLLMAQVVLAIFAGWCAGKILNELRESGKKLIIFLLLTFLFFSLVLSLSGLGYEFYGRWKERKVLRWEESQLLLWIEKTKYGEKTAFFEANEAYTAAELIPVISGRVTNTLGTFGGWVYLTNKDAQIRENYSVSTISSYLERSIDFDLDDFLKKTGNWLAYVKPDYLIMRNKLWVEEDINPFLIIFKQLFPETSFEVGNYTVFLYPKMDKEKFYKVKESITPILKEEVIPGKESFFLPLGFYLVKICGQNHSGTFTHLDLKIERYFSLLYTNLQDNEEKCYQRLFWSPKDNQYVFVLQSSPKIPLQIEIEKLNLPSL